MQEKLPDVFIFNPTCEYAVANGNGSWQPNRLLQKMEEDLSVLPLYFAAPGDFILVRKMPSAAFLQNVQQLISVLPNFSLLKDAITDPLFQNSPKNKLIPWGWSPAVHQLLAPLKPSCSAEFKHSPVAYWKPSQRDFYSKRFAAEILKKVSSTLSGNILLPENMMPVLCKTKEDFEVQITRWGKIMVKAPWSSSGRGLQPVTKLPVHPKVWEKLLGIVKEQGYAIVEPFLNKVFDFAFQFQITKGKVSFLGFSYFQTDKKGQYLGNYLNGIPEGTSKELISFIEKSSDLILKPIAAIIEQSELSQNYEGNFGVDALIYRSEVGELCVNPCLEINLRQNMGLLALHLNDYLVSGKKGIFKIYFEPGKTFHAFTAEMIKKHPLQLLNNKIESGFFALTEADENALFGAFLLV